MMAISNPSWHYPSGSRKRSIYHGKSITSAMVWVGHPKVGATISGEFALGQVGNHETCHGFVACPSRAGLSKPAGSTIADQIKAPTGKETKSTL
jgi:hypothetical protein